MPSSWGKIFRVSTFGESHGPGVGVVIDGVPPGYPFLEKEIQKDLTRRRPGQNPLTTPREEDDAMEVLSGVFQGKTTGHPIAILVRNLNVKSEDYSEMVTAYRPNHSDYTFDVKYGFRDHRGGGRSSVRETIARVAAGALARTILEKDFGTNVVGWVDSVGEIDSEISEKEYPNSRDAVDQFITRCPKQNSHEKMATFIEKLRDEGDSVGGTVKLVAYNIPPGLGDPVYDKLDADLAKAILSIPACKGFEIGSGFAGTKLTGSLHNDPFFMDPITQRVRTKTNNSGGVQGGISNGESIVIRAAFKPTSTIKKEQNTVTNSGKDTVLAARGRHDPCVLPRAVPIVEAVVNLVLVDAYLYQRGQNPDWFLKYRS